jgi:hypothetical protein
LAKAQNNRRRWRGWLKGIAIAFVAALAVLTAAVLVLAHRAEPLLRGQIVQALADHFHARVELDSFHLKLRNGLWAEGRGLRIWPPAQVAGVAIPGNAVSGSGTAELPAGGKPLIEVADFKFHAPLHYNPSEPLHVSVVEITGLDVDVPPRPHFEHSLADLPANGAALPDAGKSALALLHFDIASLECTNARLTIETSKPGKMPLVFAIAHLAIKGFDPRFGPGRAMQFAAELTNPRPQGTIHTSGSFGPWLVSDPGESPVEGKYDFEHADLSSFKGIAGILNSTGQFKGTLRNIEVNGATDTPDFRLTHFGTALPLHTNFHALVDGTNGDTHLNQVEATLERSHFWVEGQIVRVAAAPGHAGGHDIDLNLNVDRGRMEDFLRLTARSGKPLLTGALTMKAALEIPPGAEPVEKRLRIKGAFALDDAQFTSAKIQDRIGELSARGQGEPKDAKNGGSANVRSAMHGDFQMAEAVITLPALTYTVPGAEIDLKGTYGVEGGTLNFRGTAKLQATVSAMVGGWKGMLIKPLDRYFKKDGAGTALPIHIDGTRADPRFGVDFGRIKTTSPERPDEAR